MAHRCTLLAVDKRGELRTDTSADTWPDLDAATAAANEAQRPTVAIDWNSTRILDAYAFGCVFSGQPRTRKAILAAHPADHTLAQVLAVWHQGQRYSYRSR